MLSQSYYCVCRDARRAICAALDFAPDHPPLHAQIKSIHRELSAAVFRPAEIAPIYRFMYEKHFGRPCRQNLDRPQVQTLFSRLFAMCLREEIDPATFIAGNMHGMKFWLQKNRGKAFMPNMLSGPKARNRYDIFCRIANRRLQGKEDGCDSLTAIGKFRSAVVLSEELVLRRFTRARVSGRTISYEAAVGEADAVYGVAQEWFDLRQSLRTGSAPWNSPLSCYSSDRWSAESRLAQLSAAAAVGETFVRGFGAIVGIREFAAETFAALLRAVRPAPRRQHFSGSLPSVCGGSIAWGSAA